MSGEELPRARVRSTRRVRLVWVVPLIALALAAWLVYQHFERIGPEITIRFADGGGLRAGQTPLRYRGVQIGEVSGVGLTEDLKQATVRVRLNKSAGGIARDGTQFWVVRPQVGWGQVSGLGTVLTGPEIHVLPGKGEPKSDFTGRESAPVDTWTEGLRIVLRAVRPKGIRVNTPVYYRGVEVGEVQRIDLSPGNAASADIHVLIYRRYAALVRDGAAFWNAGGASFRANLREGVNFELESLRALVAGGIEFASPSEKAARAKPGQVFFLYDAPKQEWLAWTPRVPIPPEK